MLIAHVQSLGKWHYVNEPPWPVTVFLWWSWLGYCGIGMSVTYVVFVIKKRSVNYPHWLKYPGLTRLKRRCALVCKRWYRLSQDDSLWKRLDLGLRTVPPGVVGQAIHTADYFSASLLRIWIRILIILLSESGYRVQTLIFFSRK